MPLLRNRPWKELLGEVRLEVANVWLPPGQSPVKGDWDCEGLWRLWYQN